MEAARVAAVESYGILDTPADPRFEAVARAAAFEAQAPIAMVSFIDHDRQWVKAGVGWDLREVPRHLSFCHHTIHEASGALAVPHTLADPRFSKHPLVRDAPHLRSYAGVSLVDRDEYRIGTLSVLSDRPGALDATHFAALQRLSEGVLDLLPDRGGLRVDGTAAGPAPAGDGHANSLAAPTPVQAWLGVRTQRMFIPYGAEPCGRLLLSVAQGSPAERAGLRAGDILLSIDGWPVPSARSITNLLAGRMPGEHVPVKVLREGLAASCEVVAEAMPLGRRTRQRMR